MDRLLVNADPVIYQGDRYRRFRILGGLGVLDKVRKVVHTCYPFLVDLPFVLTGPSVNSSSANCLQSFQSISTFGQRSFCRWQNSLMLLFVRFLVSRACVCALSISC
jgi:hypothetical protein